MDKFRLLHSGYSSVSQLICEVNIAFSNFADFRQLQIPNARKKYYEILPAHTKTPHNKTHEIANRSFEFKYHFLILQNKFRLLLNKGVHNFTSLFPDTMLSARSSSGWWKTLYNMQGWFAFCTSKCSLRKTPTDNMRDRRGKIRCKGNSSWINDAYEHNKTNSTYHDTDSCVMQVITSWEIAFLLYIQVVVSRCDINSIIKEHKLRNQLLPFTNNLQLKYFTFFKVNFMSGNWLWLR